MRIGISHIRNACSVERERAYRMRVIRLQYEVIYAHFFSRHCYPRPRDTDVIARRSPRRNLAFDCPIVGELVDARVLQAIKLVVSKPEDLSENICVASPQFGPDR
jgi:hypothetical protein